MEVIKLGFLTVRWLDIIDILIVSYLLFKLYYMVKGSNAITILWGVATLYILWIVCARILNLQLIGGLLNQFTSVGLIILIIIFQQEVRKFLLFMGKNRIFNSNSWLGRLLGLYRRSVDTQKDLIDHLVRSCTHMSKTKTGAIIAISRNSDLGVYVSTGIKLDAEVSTELLESIFIKTSPLHDGAVVINSGKLVAASCLLPVSQRHNLPVYMGTRHRAAIGLSEETDALIIVVSEQNGSISLMHDGNYRINLKPVELERLITKIIENEQED